MGSIYPLGNVCIREKCYLDLLQYREIYMNSYALSVMIEKNKGITNSETGVTYGTNDPLNYTMFSDTRPFIYENRIFA